MAKDDFDLVEIIEAGLEALYPDDKERFQTMAAIAESLRAGIRQGNNRKAEGNRLADRLADVHHDAATAAGVCSHCGEELHQRTEHQAHPYGSTWAVETTTGLYCDSCGEL